MSKRNDEKKPGISLLAVLAGLAWASVLGILWWAKPGEDETVSDFWIFLGRFHALIVHIPIGLILVVPVLEVFGRWFGNKPMRTAVPTILWMAVLGAMAATVMGYLLMTGEPDDSVLMERHLWTGLIFGAFALITLILRLRSESFLYLVSLALSVVSVSLAGHFGGALVHGSSYLTKYAPESLKPLLLVGLGESPLTLPVVTPPVEEAPAAEAPLVEKVVFTEFVLPIMEAKCTECHNEEKSKGKLRLDTHQFIMAGAEGADYPNVAPNDSEGSELIYRVLLPTDDDDFMPPDGNEPLTPEELAVLRWWIDGGASAEATVADLQADDEMTARLLALSAALKGDEEAAAAIASNAGLISEWDLLTPEVQQERMNEVLAAAEHFNFSVMPISAEDDRLKVNVVNAAKEFGDEQLATLSPVAERIIWLDLGRSQVTDAGMKTVGNMRNLERLHLENTKITDGGIASLAGLSKLEYLNLYGTEVTSKIFESLANAKNLRKLYLWQTKVDPADARIFQRSMSLEVNIGNELATDAPEEPAKDAAKPEEAKKEAPPAPAKPEAKPKPATPAPATPPKPEAPKGEVKKPESPAKTEPKPKPAAPKTEAKPAAKPAAPKTDAKPATKPATPAPLTPKPEAKKEDAPTKPTPAAKPTPAPTPKPPTAEKAKPAA